MFSRRDRSIIKAPVNSSCTVLSVTAVGQVTSFELNSMASAIRSVGSAPNAAPFRFTGASQSSSSREPEVIEIDDNDDEEMTDASNDPHDEDVQEEGEDDEDVEEEEEEEEEESSDERRSYVNGTDAVMADVDSAPVVNGQNGHATSPSILTSSGAQRALHPLRRTADRVSRQMQAFAEKLDRFKQQESTPGDEQSFQAAYALVKNFQQHAQTAIQDIQRQDTLRRAKQGWNSSRDTSQSVDELKKLQREEDAWELLLNLIALDSPSAQDSAKRWQVGTFNHLHRYSTDREIWDQFLRADHFASQCLAVMKWLEKKARSHSQTWDSMISDLEKRAERGEGLWAHGWLYTKEAIKGQKRLKSWPQPLEPEDHGVALSLVTSEQKEPLITQLDPDAVTRQKQSLQKQDKFFEQATWLTCWKMLRQGESWNNIRRWSRERLESWRAVSLCGSSVDMESYAGRTPLDDGCTRMMNCRSQDAWRAACSAIARDPYTDDYQKAVYALLCGETEPAYKVCQSWDDYVYVFYNHLILSRYRNYCTQFLRKLTQFPLADVPFKPEPATYTSVQSFLENLQSNQRVKAEAHDPYHIIYAAMLSRNYDAFLLPFAKAAAKVCRKAGFDPGNADDNVESSAWNAMQDPDALRIVAHLYIIAKRLEYARTDAHATNFSGLCVMAYIESLREAQLLAYVPMYASLLPTDLCHDALARFLISVVDTRERERQTKLLEKYRIDARAVLERQWRWANDEADRVRSPSGQKIRLRRSIRDLHRVPKIMPVRKKFAGNRVSPQDEDLVRSLEWHKYLGADWKTICRRGSQLYRRFLVDGSLNAARELSTRMSISQISEQLLGFDMRDGPPPFENGSVIRPASPVKARGTSRSRLDPSLTSEAVAEMFAQGQLMVDLEQLILCFDALEEFQLTWEKLERARNSTSEENSASVNELRHALQFSLDRVTAYITGLFETPGPGVLTDAEDDVEATELAFIRHTYLPEAILNFTSALYYASLRISRNILVHSMNLSVMVAGDQNIIDSFMSSKRMEEFVSAMALTSSAMVNAPESDDKKDEDGGHLGIWNIGTDEPQPSQSD